MKAVSVLLNLLTVIVVAATPASAQPAIALNVADTAVAPNSPLPYLSIFLSNPDDSLAGIQFTLESTRPDLVKFTGFDSSGTLVSGLDIVGAYDVEGDSSKLEFVCLADTTPFNSIRKGIPLQPGDVAVKITFRSFDLPADTTSLTSLIRVIPTISFAALDGSSIGVITDTVVDTLYQECTQFVDDTCAEWTDVGPGGNWDRIVIDSSLVGYIDTNVVQITDGSITVAESVCAPCDIDCSSSVDIGDLTALILCLFIDPAECEQFAFCDINFDGTLDIGDLSVMITTLFNL